MFINFADIPGHQKLFLDYLYDFNKVKKFYKNNVHDKDNYLSIFKRISAQKKVPRTQLTGILTNQYNGLPLSSNTSKNIAILSDNNTLAVVTGQQLGILGGPMYTLYKIITAIKLSNYLSQRYDDFNFVPVFWLEADDHDFNEVRSISVINDSNEIKVISYGEEVSEDESKSSVGEIIFNDSLNNFFAELESSSRSTEFTAQLFSEIKSIYSPGKAFKQAFKELIFSFFDRYGLVIFDPQDKEIKNLLKPVFKKEISDFRIHTEKLVNISAQLEESYHAQVKVRPVNLFYKDSDGRYLIEPGENEFGLKRKRKKFSYEELIDTIEKEPENFSPNVLLRPICQDYILPTAFYVGGPSEIAYFAQVMPLYDFFGIEAPVIYPRSSATIIEKNISSLLERYELKTDKVFKSGSGIKQQIINSLTSNSIDDIFNNATNQIDAAFDSLKEKLFEFDKTVSDSSSKYKQKINQYLAEYKSKATEAQKRKHETTLRQIDKILNTIYPNANLQEREINFIYFLNKYGKEFLDKVFDETMINKFEHQIIEL